MFEMKWQILFICFFPVTLSSLHLNDVPFNCQNNNTACENFDDNLIQTIHGIYTLLECREICLDNTECEFITYFGQTGIPLRNSCQLFRSCESTIDCTGSKMETGFEKPYEYFLVSVVFTNQDSENPFSISIKDA